jgi:hypothetical protein
MKSIRIFRVGFGRALGVAGALAFSLMIIPSVFGQTENMPGTEAVSENKAVAEATTQAPQPLIGDIKGITLGMTADEVKSKLGKPETSDASTMYYDLNKGESVQLQLDSDKKVVMVAAMYTGNKADAPDVAEVFGSDVKIVPRKDSRIYKLVRYPAAGYWVAYDRLQLDSGPMTTVTIKKIKKIKK